MNGITWCWSGPRPYLDTLHPYCKCGYELEFVKPAESWQADFRCPRCGKSYVSTVNTGAKPRNLAKTRHMVAEAIAERLSKC